MKVDYLSEFGFRLSDYGEYRQRAGAGRAGPERRPLRARDGMWGWGPLGLAGPIPSRAIATGSFCFSWRNSRLLRACGPERESEREARSKLSPPPPSRPGPARPGARPPARDALGPAGRDSGRAGTGGPRDTKHSSLFFSWRFSKSLGPRSGEWILEQVRAVGTYWEALSLFFWFFDGS